PGSTLGRKPHERKRRERRLRGSPPGRRPQSGKYAGGPLVSDAEQELVVVLGFHVDRAALAVEVVADGQPVALQLEDCKHAAAGIGAVATHYVDGARTAGLVHQEFPAIHDLIAAIDDAVVVSVQHKVLHPQLTYDEILAGHVGRDRDPRAL